MTTPALPVLYSFRRCPYAIRARMALRYAGIEVTVREVALGDKPADFVALSPKATVPVLHLPSGEVIDQSLAIMQWALQQYDPQGWLSAGPADEATHWISQNDDAFKPLLDRYKIRHPPPRVALQRQPRRRCGCLDCAAERALAASALPVWPHPFAGRCCPVPLCPPVCICGQGGV